MKLTETDKKDMSIDFNEGSNIAEKWYNWASDANPYIFGEKELDKEEFRHLIEETYLFFKKVNRSLDVPWKEDEIKTNKRNVQYMHEVLSFIGEYVAEQCTEDESEDKVFTASCLVARALVNFAIKDYDEYYDGGKEPLLYYHPEWWIYDIMDSSNEDYRVYSYDYNDGDMSDMLILAKYIN